MKKLVLVKVPMKKSLLFFASTPLHSKEDSPLGVRCLMKRFWILPLLAGFFAAIAIAQEAVVVVNTGLSDRVYEEGVRHESPPVIVRPGTNRFVQVFDTRNHTDPNVCVDFGSERSLDGGKTWQDFSLGSGICGQSSGFKDKQGNPLSSAGAIISGEFAQSEIMLRSVLVVKRCSVQGGELQCEAPVKGRSSLRTSSTIQMKEIR